MINNIYSAFNNLFAFLMMQQLDKISTISKLDDFFAKNAKTQKSDGEVAAKLDINGGDLLTQTDEQVMIVLYIYIYIFLIINPRV